MGNYNCSPFKTSKVISYPLFCENSNLSALQEQGRTDRVQGLSYTPNPHRNPTPPHPSIPGEGILRTRSTSYCSSLNGCQSFLCSYLSKLWIKLLHINHDQVSLLFLFTLTSRLVKIPPHNDKISSSIPLRISFLLTELPYRKENLNVIYIFPCWETGFK